MSAKLTVKYSLNPPVETKALDSGATSKNYEYSLPVEGTQTVYYEQLRKVVLEAKAKIGEELTSWRDAVGTLENKKEPKKPISDDEDDSENEIEDI